jgi:thymidylate synthase (FAD)
MENVKTTPHSYANSIPLYSDDIGSVSYVSHMGSDLTVVNSARVSFGTSRNELNDKDRKLINYLIKHRHTSTLEHCAITFKFSVPIFVRSQHHRHRTWSYNEISRRYTNVNLRFYEPKAFRTQHKSNRQASNAEELIDPEITTSVFNEDGSKWEGFFIDQEVKSTNLVKEHHEQSLSLFNQLIEAGVCREQARGVLPQNLYTEYYGTVNLSNLLKFIDLRTHEGAQWEIQKVAEACLKIATDLFPETVDAYRKIKENTN